jgi:hypothetical protein
VRLVIRIRSIVLPVAKDYQPPPRVIKVEVEEKKPRRHTFNRWTRYTDAQELAICAAYEKLPAADVGPALGIPITWQTVLRVVRRRGRPVRGKGTRVKAA